MPSSLVFPLRSLLLLASFTCVGCVVESPPDPSTEGDTSDVDVEIQPADPTPQATPTTTKKPTQPVNSKEYTDEWSTAI